MTDLSKLINRSDHTPKALIISITGVIEAAASPKYSRISSTYKEIRLPTRIPRTQLEVQKEPPEVNSSGLVRHKDSLVSMNHFSDDQAKSISQNLGQ